MHLTYALHIFGREASSRVEGSTPVRYDRAVIALAILIGMIGVASLEWLDALARGYAI